MVKLDAEPGSGGFTCERIRLGYLHRHTCMLHVWLYEEDRYRRMVARTARRIVQSLKE